MKFVIILSLLICSAVFAQDNVQDLVVESTSVGSEVLSEQPQVEQLESSTALQEADTQREVDVSVNLDANEGALESPVADVAESSDLESEINNGVEEDIPAASDVMPQVEYQQGPVKTAQGGSEVVNLSATIVGNQEQPTVLYIVPWKPAEDTTILYLPLSSKAMEHIFGHVERVEHQRQVQYIDQLDKQ